VRGHPGVDTEIGVGKGVGQVSALDGCHQLIVSGFEFLRILGVALKRLLFGALISF